MQELPKRLAIPSMRTLIGLASLLTESRSAPRRNRMRLIHSELLRHGYWPIGVGPRDPETWADRKLKRKFCFRVEGPRRVRLVEITA